MEWTVIPYPEEHSSMPLLLMNDWQILLIHPDHKSKKEIKDELVLHLLLENIFRNKIRQTTQEALNGTFSVNINNN